MEERGREGGREWCQFLHFDRLQIKLLWQYDLELIVGLISLGQSCKQESEQFLILQQQHRGLREVDVWWPSRGDRDGHLDREGCQPKLLGAVEDNSQVLRIVDVGISKGLLKLFEFGRVALGSDPNPCALTYDGVRAKAKGAAVERRGGLRCL